MWQNSIKCLLLCMLMTTHVGATSLRDPTLPPALLKPDVIESVEQPKTNLKLNGILRGPQGIRAVINNKIYQQGNSVDGVVVTQIGKSSVLLADGRRLQLFQAIVERKGNK